MSADHQAHGVTIAEVARLLGVSENAIRQRIKRGTLPAAKVDGVWHVAMIESAPTADHDAGYQNDQEFRPAGAQERQLLDDYQGTNQPTVSVSARAQLSALVEEMLAPIIAQHEEQTTKLARQLGRTEAERDQVRQERDMLQAELDRLKEAEAAGAPEDAPDASGRADHPPWTI